jgi:hypothetical protein
MNELYLLSLMRENARVREALTALGASDEEMSKASELAESSGLEDARAMAQSYVHALGAPPASPCGGSRSLDRRAYTIPRELCRWDGHGADRPKRRTSPVPLESAELQAKRGSAQVGRFRLSIASVGTVYALAKP